MSQQDLSDCLKYALRISHTEEGWISPFRDVVRDTDFEAAKWKPAPEVASIWEIVAHAVPYTESRLCDLTGDPYPDEQDWPGVTDATPEAWEALQSRVDSVVTKLETAVEALTGDELAAPVRQKTPRAERLMDIAIHDAYHAGQIVKLQQLYAAVGGRELQNA